jgi:hypothetical protein
MNNWEITHGKVMIKNQNILQGRRLYISVQVDVKNNESKTKTIGYKELNISYAVP